MSWKNWDTYKVLVRRPGEKRPHKYLVSHVRIILKLILYRVRRCNLDSTINRQGSVVGFCEYFDESLGFVRGGKCFTSQETEIYLISHHRSSWMEQGSDVVLSWTRVETSDSVENYVFLDQARNYFLKMASRHLVSFISSQIMSRVIKVEVRVGNCWTGCLPVRTHLSSSYYHWN